MKYKYTEDGPVPEYAPHLGPCWIWQGRLTASGYGPHRRIYLRLVGPIEPGLQLDHLCRVRSCVNPSHLEPVTVRENALRSQSFAAVNAVKTHCYMGHPLEGENLIIDRHGWRRCHECRNERARRFAARNRGYSTKYARRSRARRKTAA